jgi:trimethylamine--corrinoid protein Co-methyltransferase
MRLSHGTKVYTTTEMHRIHEAMLKVLAEAGLELQLPEPMLKKLADQGLEVDFKEKIIRFPAEPVLETIRQLAGAETTGIGQDGVAKPPQPHRLPVRIKGLVGTNHGFVFDTQKDLMRDATHQDMVDFIKIKRCLPGVLVGNSGIWPQDVPQSVASVHAAAMAVKYCEDPIAPAVHGVVDLPWVERVMVAAGIWTEKQHKLANVYPLSPRRIAGRGGELMAYHASRGDLALVSSMVIPGTSSPATLAGHTLMVLVEAFGFNTAFRLLVDPPNNTFSPRSVGDDVCLIDFREGAMILASPEISLLRSGVRQIVGEFYKLPGATVNGIRMFSNANEPGIQAAMESSLMAMADLCQGMYSYDEAPECTMGIIGSLNGNLSLCAEQVLMDYEIYQYLCRYAEGIRVDEEHLAADLIQEVVPGGNFMETVHTARHFRKDYWFPQLLHRGTWDSWLASGRQDPLEVARSKVDKMLAEELPPVLDEPTLRDVRKVVEDAEIALLGETTGIYP